MAEDVEQHQRSAVEQERIKRELELGRQIQHDMLPQGAAALRSDRDQGRLGAGQGSRRRFLQLLLARRRPESRCSSATSRARASGAALLMANIQASLRTRLALGQDLDAIAREIDVDIEGNTPGPIYATLFVGIFNPATRELRYVNAGHNPAVHPPHHRHARAHVIVRPAGRAARGPRLRRSARPAGRRRSPLLLYRRLRRGRERSGGHVRRGEARRAARCLPPARKTCWRVSKPCSPTIAARASRSTTRR